MFTNIIIFIGIIIGIIIIIKSHILLKIKNFIKGKFLYIYHNYISYQIFRITNTKIIKYITESIKKSLGYKIEDDRGYIHYSENEIDQYIDSLKIYKHKYSSDQKENIKLKENIKELIKLANEIKKQLYPFFSNLERDEYTYMEIWSHKNSFNVDDRFPYIYLNQYFYFLNANLVFNKIDWSKYKDIWNYKKTLCNKDISQFEYTHYK